MRSPRPNGARTWQGEVSFLLSDPGYPDTAEIFVRTNHHHHHHDNQTTPTPTPSLPDASAAEPPISTLSVPSLAWSQALSCHGLYIVQVHRPYHISDSVYHVCDSVVSWHTGASWYFIWYGTSHKRCQFNQVLTLP